MSKICLNSSINKQSDCFPSNYTDKDGMDFATMAGILCILNAIIGTFGNLLTILALPFAARRKKYDSKIIKGAIVSWATRPWDGLFFCPAPKYI